MNPSDSTSTPEGAAPSATGAQTSRRPLRVLLVENTIRGFGGSYESLYLTAKGLHQGRFDPVVLFFQPNHFAEKLRERGIRVLLRGSRYFWERESYRSGSGTIRSRLPRRGFLGAVRRKLSAFGRAIVGGLPMAGTVYRVLRREKIDILHTNNNLQRDSMVILAGILAGVPIVSHERQLAACSAWTGFLSRKVRVLICISDAVLEFSRRSGARVQNRKRIHNALEFEEFRCVRPALPPGPPRIGIVGRIMPKKGQRYFVEAAALVAERFPDAEFFVIGEATGENHAYEDEVRALATSLGVGDRFRWTGYLQEPLGHVASLDVMVHAAIEPEPFGRVIIEALALGVPVVATSLGGPLEIIEEGRSGFLIPSHDPKAMADKVIALLADRSLHDRIREGGMERIRSHFGLERYVRAIEEAYDLAVSGASESAGPVGPARGGADSRTSSGGSSDGGMTP